MVKLYPQHARELLVLLTAIREEYARIDDGHTAAINANWMARLNTWFNVPENQVTPLGFLLASLNWDSTLESLNLDEVINDLVDQLGTSKSSNAGDPSLIDTIVDVLQLPMGTNRLSSESLQALRRAVLRPSEVANFQKASRDHFACSACGHKFVAGELGTVFKNGDETSIRCARCADPVFGICPSCRESAPVNSTGTLALRSGKFVTCTCKTKPKKSPHDALMEAARGLTPGVMLDEQAALPNIGNILSTRAAARRAEALLRGRQTVTFTGGPATNTTIRDIGITMTPLDSNDGPIFRVSRDGGDR